MPVPDGFHWDVWLGQAPKVEYLKERCHANFRWWFDYSGGPVTDWGAHHNDIARWAIGLDGPTAIQARAPIAPIPGGYTTPPEFEATLLWANGVRQIVKTTPDDTPYGGVIKPDGQRNGVRLEGTEGWIWVNRSTIEASDQAMLDTPLENPKVRLEVSDDHMANFFDAVRSRKDPVSPVEAGHQSAVVGHLIVIALRTGRTLTWDPSVETFVGVGPRRRTRTWRARCESRTITASLAESAGLQRVRLQADTTDKIALTTGSRPGLQHRNAVTPEASVVEVRRSSTDQGFEPAPRTPLTPQDVQGSGQNSYRISYDF